MSAFVQARNYTPGPRTRGAVRLIVVHDMEASERFDTAESCAAYFANQPPHNPPHFYGSSCHWSVDADSEVQSVREVDIAWHCPGANHDGIGIEHAGFARQSREEWLDEYGIAMLRRSAALIVDIAGRWDIPLVWLEADDVAAGAAGITTHRACTEAFDTFGGHTDPGPDFPADVLMGFVADIARKSRPLPEEDEMVQFPICAITSGPLAGRWAKVRVEDGGAKLRLWFGEWVDVPDDAVSSGLGTAVLDVAKALGKPALNGSVAVGQSGPTIVVSDDDGDYGFGVKVTVP